MTKDQATAIKAAVTELIMAEIEAVVYLQASTAVPSLQLREGSKAADEAVARRNTRLRELIEEATQ